VGRGASRRSPGDVVLRDVTEVDLPVFFEHQLDPDASHMAAVPTRDWEAFKTHWNKVLKDDGITKKTVVFQGDVAGNVVSWEQDGKPLVGYWIGRSYWGRGVATAALSQLLDLLEMRPLYAHVAKHNIGSIRVLEKCGFTLLEDDEEPAHAPADGLEELTLKLEA
jgi:RimJ/RimL family protein N-acetyltransferase